MKLLLASLLGLTACGSPTADSPTEDSLDGGDSARPVVGDSVDSADSAPPCTDDDADGWCAPDDCADARPYVYPGAVELCNGVDDNCDGAVDEGVTKVFYRDDDGDGYGASTAAPPACSVPNGYASVGGDCEDGNPTAHPGGTEVCDLSDNDCDGIIDEGNWPRWYLDVDGDGYGDPLLHSCTHDAHYVVDGTDCQDLDDSIHPGAEERCDGWDDDCDGVVDPTDVDADADGQPICAGDCDDGQVRVAAGAPELCGDGLDNDCDGTTDLVCVDDHCDWTVPSQVATIRRAIVSAQDGDTVCVEPGTYDEYVVFDGKAITLVGSGGSAATVLAPGTDRGAVTFSAGEGRGSVLEGFTIEGGSHVDIVGASPTLVDVVVQDTFDGSWNGAITSRGGSPAFWDVIVRNASVSVGPKSEGDGGGFNFRGGSALLDHVVVEDCYAGGGGAGIQAWSAALSLTDVVLRGNYAAGNWGVGGGISTVTTTLRMKNVAVVDNFSSMGWDSVPGGGIVLDSSILSATNATICDNTGYLGGEGLRADDSVAVLTNALVCATVGSTTGRGHAGVEAESSAVRFRYSDVWGNAPADFWGLSDPTGAHGNVSVDPVVVDSDYHLDPTSPLVDAGDPRILDADGSRADIGAYGGPGAW